MDVQEHVGLRDLTTFAIGGPARFFVVVKTVDELKESLDFLRQNSGQVARDQKILILGGGSNMLVPDEGFDGLVIKIKFLGLREQNGVITAGAGEAWDSIVAYAVERGLWGIENLSGIPGTVGGAVVQNIGAYGAALSQTLIAAEVFDTKTGEIKTLSNKECRFDYRTSVFKEEEGRYVVLSATFALSSEPAPNTSYKDLHTRFAAGGGQAPTLSEIRGAIVAIRSRKFPDLSVEGTAGSFFKNPILPKEEAETLKQKYPDMPLFEMPETDGIKVPLGWLMDHALHLHGTAEGGARLFEKQILVIAARRGTSSRDVQKLAESVREKVFNELKIKIEPEVKIV